MPKRLPLAIAALSGLATASAAYAAPNRPERPEILTRVVQCRAIADAGERLACFDREVAAMDQAQASGQLVAMDRQQVRRTRRSLFGLTLPNLDLFGDNAGDEEASRIETTIRAVTRDPYGKYIFTLEDGALWRQTDSRGLSAPPRPGHAIRIRRAALGSYLANVNDQVAIRIRRVR